ncbi:MAG: uroporphyrinogen-III synthase [Thermoleophilia bacterium]|nr:uroporphyrinogen-III synthase [Thermoleophilia bacterium]
MPSAARPTVVVTGAKEGATRLLARLRGAGIAAVACPLVAIEPIEGPPVRAAAYDWVVLTSARAAELLPRRVEGPLPRVAAIGPGTAESLRARGIEPALVARTSTQEGLLEELPHPAGRVLFAGAEGARELLARELQADVVALYRTVELRPEAFPPGDLVVVASPSAARALAALELDLPCVSIGPVTSAEVRRLRLRLAAEATSHDLGGLVAAVRLAASRLRSSPC